MSSSFEQNSETVSQTETSSDQRFEAIDLNAVENGKQLSTPEDEVLRQSVRDFVAGLETLPPSLPHEPNCRDIVLKELIAALAIPSDETAPEATAAHLEREERARELFIDYGFLDKTIDDLRTEGDTATRAEAAYLLGLVRSQRGTAPLIAALFDDEPDVREAATKALSEIGDPAVSMGPLNEPSKPEAELVSPPEAENQPEYAAAVSETPLTPDSTSATAEESTQDPEIIRLKIDELEAELFEIVTARSEAEREVRQHIEQEATFRVEAAARRHEDEENRKRAEEKVNRRRYEDDRKLASEHLGRNRAEIDAHDLAEKETRLRMEAFTLRTTVQELTRQQAQEQAAKLVMAQAAELAEAEAALLEATEQHTAELDGLRREEELLRTTSAEAARRRSEVEAERRRNEIDTQQLLEEQSRLAAADKACREEAERVREAEAKLRHDQEELLRRAEELQRLAEVATTRRHELDAAQHRAQEEEQQLYDLEIRTQAAEDSRRQAQSERMRLESEIRHRQQSEQHLLEEVRARAVEQEESLAEAGRKRAEEQNRRRAELDALRVRLEADMQRRSEQEADVINHIEGLRAAEAEMRKRMEELETQRGTADRSHGVIVEQIQRMEAEARLSSTEEQRALAKLEEARRNVSQQNQSLVEQQERIKQEIESLRKTEEENRKRLDLEVQRRAQAEIRLQHEKERQRLAEEARARAEALVEHLTRPSTENVEEEREWHDDPAENLRRLEPTTAPVVFESITTPETAPVAEPAAVRPSEAPPAPAHSLPVPSSLRALNSEEVLAKLKSDDSSERAAALATLPELELPDAFDLIVKHFDDPATEVRDTAARSLREIEPLRPVDPFTRALEEATPERRRNIGLAIASSGLAAQSLNDLDADSREDTYNALCLLFVMAKTGEVQPLVEAIETHPDVEVRRAAIKLLNLSGQSELAEAAAKRRLGLGRTNGS